MSRFNVYMCRCLYVQIFEWLPWYIFYNDLKDSNHKDSDYKDSDHKDSDPKDSDFMDSDYKDSDPKEFCDYTSSWQKLWLCDDVFDNIFLDNFFDNFFW